MNLFKHRIALQQLLAMICLATLMVGCSSLFGPKFVVPERSTPREQAQIADRQLREAQQAVEPKLRKTQFEKAILAFQMVQKRFPDDRVYTPAATLMEGDLYFEIENDRKAEVAYRRTIDRYPTIADVHAGALLGLGLTLYRENRNKEGNETLDRLVEQYGRSEDPVIQARVRRANSQKDRVR